MKVRLFDSDEMLILVSHALFILWGAADVTGSGGS